MDIKQIHFDQYSRYKCCADIVQQVSNGADTVLDIGCGESCLLEKFLPDRNITFIDPLLKDDDDGNVRINGNIFSGKLDQKSFGVVVSVDTLEHVEPQMREKFLARIQELAKKTIVLGAPFRDSSNAKELDTWVNDVYRVGFDKDYHWLSEHFDFGLPSLELSKQTLENAGYTTVVRPNGYLPWLRSFLPFTLCALETRSLESDIVEINEFFNEHLQEYDNREPAYRHFIVATKDPSIDLQQLVGSPTDSTASGSVESDNADFIVQRIAANPIKKVSTLEKEVNSHINYSNKLLTQNNKLHEKMKLLEDRVKYQDDTIKQKEKMLGIVVDQLNTIESSKSWQYTAPLRSAIQIAKNVKSTGMRNSAYKGTRIVFNKLPISQKSRHYLKKPFQPILERIAPTSPSIQLTPFDSSSMPELPGQNSADVFLWAVIDWDFRKQRPQHIANCLGNLGHRIFYVSATFSQSEEAGFIVRKVEDTNNVFVLKLNLDELPHIHSRAATKSAMARLNEDLRLFLQWTTSNQVFSIVNHPWWSNLANSIPNSRTIYDCMDYHEGFGNYDSIMQENEKSLLRSADAVIATSGNILEFCKDFNDNVYVVRNGCDYEHFSFCPDDIFIDKQGRKIIGYYGAIAEWFDVDLIQKVAQAYPEYLILLVGNDSAGVELKLAGLSNVQFTGEVSYDQLPYYLYAFDVCVLPFKVNELTNATNPVKLYEYLSAGRPVVSVDLPEIHEFLPHVDIATSPLDFIEAVHRRLSDSEESDAAERQEFAKSNTWESRAKDIVDQVFSAPESLCSIVVITYNNVELTKKCLESIYTYTAYSNFEVFVVDNASTDYTHEYLSRATDTYANLNLICNEENLGFAVAVNQGIKAATGEHVVILNNDVQVTPGWLRTMRNHFKRDSSLGILGPLTNNIGNEAKIDITYTNNEEMLEKVGDIILKGVGNLFDIHTVAFFCVMLPKHIVGEVGLLDESYTVGFFEDDDYCRRIQQAGYRIACAEDVFIHHELSASFNELDENERLRIFEHNKKIYESKWGTWTPHAYRN